MENNLECTYVMIKPDIMNRSLEESENIISYIIDRYNERGLDVIAMNFDKLGYALAKEHYAHLEGEDFFDVLINFMVSGNVCKMIVVGFDAVRIVREINGPTNVLKAKEESPDSIRALFGNPNFGPANAIHASDSKENAEIEINRFYPYLNFKQPSHIKKEKEDSKKVVRKAYAKKI